MDEGYRDALDMLRKSAVLREYQFTSHVPLVGGLIARFRRAWNGVSTRWYVAPALRQQSQVNELTVELLTRLNEQVEGQQRETGAQLTAFREEFALLQRWLVSQDRDQAAIRHDLGELAAHVAALSRLAGLEVGNEQPDSQEPTGSQE